MSADRSEVIELDWRTGKLTGANAKEKAALAATIAASHVLTPLKKFGLSYVTGTLASILSSPKAVRVRFTSDELFDFPYGDRYWSQILPRRGDYEKEIATVLSAFAGEPFLFIDCGANYGYWSVRVSGQSFGHQRVIAIEAAPDTFQWLQRNARNNSNRFVALNRAISATPGEMVTLYGEKHEARSIVEGEGGPAIGTVETISLDKLLEREELATADRIVLKLDVEGAELAALEGGKRMLDRDLLIAYEDHGSDRAHSVSAYLKDQLGMRLYYVENGRARELNDFRKLDSLKASRRFGYDFFASRSPFWIERMARLAAGSSGSNG